MCFRDFSYLCTVFITKWTFQEVIDGRSNVSRVREVQTQDVERETGRLLVFLSHTRLKDRGASEESAMTGLEWKLSVLCKIIRI